MTDKEKANNIAKNNLDRCFGNEQDYGATCALEMAAWKEQQMMNTFKTFVNRKFHKGDAEMLIRDFKKAMEE